MPVDKVLLAAPRGFCAGVEMAIKALAWMVRAFEPPVYCYHEIVHNQLVVDRFRALGVVFVDEIDEVPEGRPIMLSAHGSAPEVVAAARGRGSFVVDAVCPLVTKVHHEVKVRAGKGYQIVYVGHEGHEEAVGTMVVEDTLDDLRPANLDDVGAIVQLIEPLEIDGTLVPRGRSVIEREVERFTVLEHDGIIYGCVALIPYEEESMAEMACLIVHPEWQGSGEGEILLRHTEAKARAAGFKRLFVLTTRTSHWFIKRGFVQGGVSDLPKGKQSHYNRSRNSMVFIKKL